VVRLLPLVHSSDQVASVPDGPFHRGQVVVAFRPVDPASFPKDHQVEVAGHDQASYQVEGAAYHLAVLDPAFHQGVLEASYHHHLVQVVVQDLEQNQVDLTYPEHSFHPLVDSSSVVVGVLRVTSVTFGWLVEEADFHSWVEDICEERNLVAQVKVQEEA